jgi:hypothetical protein
MKGAFTLCSVHAHTDHHPRLYYQHDLGRMSACPLTIHALLHIADSIEALGPVWCYWCFPVERYCGHLLRTVKSRRHPYASINIAMVREAQLLHIKIIFNLEERLSLRKRRPTSLGFCYGRSRANTENP